jgi:hypothetical protein
MAVARRLPSADPLLTLVRTCALSSAQAIALAVCPALSAADQLAMLEALTTQTPPKYKVGVVTQYLRRADLTLASSAAEELAALVSLTVAQAVLARAQDQPADLKLTGAERSLLSRTAGLRAAMWFNLDEPVGDEDSPADLVATAGSEFSAADPAERKAAKLIAFTRAIPRCRTQADVSDLIEELNGAEPGYEDRAIRLVACALRELRSTGDSNPAVSVIMYLASGVKSKDLRVHGYMTVNDDLDENLVELVRSLSPELKEAISDSLTKPKLLRQWWAVLCTS